MNKEILETIFAGITLVLALGLLGLWLFYADREAKKERQKEQEQEKQFQDALIKELHEANENIKFIYECKFPRDKEE